MFLQATETCKAVRLTMITTYGVERNEYAGLTLSEVVMDDLKGTLHTTPPSPQRSL